MPTFSFGDTVLVPFPFTDMPQVKRRPCVVVSAYAFNQANEQSVMAMITTAGASSWAGDIPIADCDAAGISHPSVIRFKLFTLPNDMVLRRLGALAIADLSLLRTKIGTIFA